MADNPQQRTTAPAASHGRGPHPATTPDTEKAEDTLVAVVALADINFPRIVVPEERDVSGKVIPPAITQRGGTVHKGETVHVPRSVADNWIASKIVALPKDVAEKKAE